MLKTITLIWLGFQTCGGDTDLDDEFDSFFQGDLIFEILFQNVLSTLTVGTNGCSLPAAIIATGITLIKLKAICRIPAQGLLKDALRA